MGCGSEEVNCVWQHLTDMCVDSIGGRHHRRSRLLIQDAVTVFDQTVY